MFLFQKRQSCPDGDHEYSPVSSFPGGLCCKENVLGKIGGICFFVLGVFAYFSRQGFKMIHAKCCQGQPLPWSCRELCLRLLEHGQGGIWGILRCGSGVRNSVWGTVYVSVPGVLHTPQSSTPAGPCSVGKVSPFNALSPCSSSLRTFAASGMCLEEFRIVAFCLGSFSSGKKIWLH